MLKIIRWPLFILVLFLMILEIPAYADDPVPDATPGESPPAATAVIALPKITPIPDIPGITPPPRMYSRDDGDHNVYTGELKNGQIDGYAIVHYNSGALYVGELHNYMANGPGRMDWPDGTRFEGTFQEGNALKGKLTMADGVSILEGDFDPTLPVMQAAVRVKGSINRTSMLNGKTLQSIWKGVFSADRMLNGVISFDNGQQFQGATALNPGHTEAQLFGFFHPVGMGSLTTTDGARFYGKWTFDESTASIRAIGSVKLKTGGIRSAKWIDGKWKIASK